MRDIRAFSCNAPSVDAAEERQCHPFRRTLGGYCTNPNNRMLGFINTGQFAYIQTQSNIIPTHTDLPSPRLISNVIADQRINMFNRNKLTDFVTFFAQFLDHNTFATAVTTESEGENFPIRIPLEDRISSNFSNGELPFRRSVRGCVVGHNSFIRRPINCLSSAIDLSAVYGPKKDTVTQLRQLSGGLLKIQQRNGLDYLPYNRGSINLERMAPIRDTEQERGKFFAAGDHRANENPVLTALHTLFLREHNKLAREIAVVLKDRLQGMSRAEVDETLFQHAKRINEAQFQKIVVEEFYPAMTNANLPKITYDQRADPSLSDVFSTAAFRVGHTMVGDEIELRDTKSKRVRTVPTTELFFKEGEALIKEGIDTFLLGAVNHRAQEIDTKVVNALRNHLFINVRGERGMFDLLALNLQRSRDHALITYNEIRGTFGLRKVQSFSEITSDRTLQNQLSTLYRTVHDIEAWIGFMAEDHMPGKPIGETLFTVWKREFSRVLSGDQFFYTHREKYATDLREPFGTTLNAITAGKRSMKDVIVRNTNIELRDLPNSLWRTN